jgi:hypothetical protein
MTGAAPDLRFAQGSVWITFVRVASPEMGTHRMRGSAL